MFIRNIEVISQIISIISAKVDLTKATNHSILIITEDVKGEAKGGAETYRGSWQYYLVVDFNDILAAISGYENCEAFRAEISNVEVKSCQKEYTYEGLDWLKKVYGNKIKRSDVNRRDIPKRQGWAQGNEESKTLKFIKLTSAFWKDK